jgi:GntR family transcriptional regulator
MTIDREGARPLYQQLASILRVKIEAGEYPAGRAIPSENRLMQEYEVARDTARKAIRLLADEGLVEIVRGRGVYVKEQPEDA